MPTRDFRRFNATFNNNTIACNLNVYKSIAFLSDHKILTAVKVGLKQENVSGTSVIAVAMKEDETFDTYFFEFQTNFNEGLTIDVSGKCTRPLCPVYELTIDTSV